MVGGLISRVGLFSEITVSCIQTSAWYSYFVTGLRYAHSKYHCGSLWLPESIWTKVVSAWWHFFLSAVAVGGDYSSTIYACMFSFELKSWIDLQLQLSCRHKILILLLVHFWLVQLSVNDEGPAKCTGLDVKCRCQNNTTSHTFEPQFCSSMHTLCLK